MLRQAYILWMRERKSRGTRLQKRLFAFFALTVTTVILSFAMLLLLFGITGSGASQTKQFVQNELLHISDSIAEDFGKLSLQGVTLSERLSETTDAFFVANNITLNQLYERPEFIEPFLDAQMNTLIGVMEREVCSGVYLLLDTTVNKNLPNAEYSRAGIFLKKTDPNTVTTVGSDVHYLRGPANVARKYKIDLLGQWKMEFDIKGEEFFEETIKIADENPALPLSRLYRWSFRTTLKDNSESGLLLCVPVRDESGKAFAICGIEVSDRQFKRRYSPDNSTYANIFTAFCPIDKGQLLAHQGMIAGNSYLTSVYPQNPFSISKGKKGFSLYKSDEQAFGGLQTDIKVYPSDSPYDKEKWKVAVMMEVTTLQSAITGNTPYLLISVVLLLAGSISMSIFISRRYLRPVIEGLGAIKSKTYGRAAKNTYMEINDLMEFLAEQEELQKKEVHATFPSETASSSMFEAFRRNMTTLSPAEKNVFDLYVKGYHAQEIADELCLSINTIKTHNRRIFAKLDVSTRKELLVYLDMMKKLDLIKER